MPSSVRLAIDTHAIEMYPHECCGFMIGTITGNTRTVKRVERLTNQRRDRAHDRYEIDPLDWLRVERTLIEPEQVIGVYHSHPDHPSRPSEFDREHAHPNMSYVIASVLTGQLDSLQSWELDDSRVFQEETILEGES
jgi:proteasome lid subunit RPN8/RPN11